MNMDLENQVCNNSKSCDDKEIDGGPGFGGS
jgi:hypothetical protein